MAELRDCDSESPQRPNDLLSGPLQEKSTDSYSRTTIPKGLF